MRNLELKARVRDLDATLETAERLAGDRNADIHQSDTCFNVDDGRGMGRW